MSRRDQLTPLKDTFLRPGHPMRAQLAAAAQTVYDDWQVDEDGYDWRVDAGGICHLIADAMTDVLGQYNVWSQTQSCSVGEVHVNVIAQFREGVFVVDINPYDYETGGGYTWKKRPDIKFTPDFVTADKLDNDPFNLRMYVEAYEDDDSEGSGALAGACGLCFPWAYEHLPDANNARLVHAIVRHPYDGRTYPHAWIERAGRIYDWQSVAQGLGPGARGWPRRKFYALWQPVEITKYDYVTARKRPWLQHAPIA